MNCFSILKGDGKYKCHWGPEEIYDCWNEGYNHISRLNMCKCEPNTKGRLEDCSNDKFGLPECMSKLNKHGEIVCHWGPGNFEECMNQEKAYLNRTDNKFGDDYVDRNAPKCQCLPTTNPKCDG